MNRFFFALSTLAHGGLVAGLYQTQPAPYPPTTAIFHVTAIPVVLLMEDHIMAETPHQKAPAPDTKGLMKQPLFKPKPVSHKPISHKPISQKLISPVTATTNPPRSPGAPSSSLIAPLFTQDRPAPPYPVHCQEAGIDGTLSFQLTISPKGQVTQIICLSPAAPRVLQDVCHRTLTHWTFPHSASSHRLIIPIIFSLEV